MKLDPQKYRQLRKYAHFVHDIGELSVNQLKTKYPEWTEMVFPFGDTMNWANNLYYLLADNILHGKPLVKTSKKRSYRPLIRINGN